MLHRIAATERNQELITESDRLLRHRPCHHHHPHHDDNDIKDDFNNKDVVVIIMIIIMNQSKHKVIT